MRRFSGLIFVALFLLLAFSASGEYAISFYPQYWASGTVYQASDGTTPNGRQVYLFKSLGDYQKGLYTVDTVGSTGSSGRPGRYLVNAFGLGVSSLSLGNTYYVGIPNDRPDNPALGYGADPVSFEVSGSGLDEVPIALQLAKGAGLPPPPPPGLTEPGPEIKLWFGSRLYQPSLVAKGEVQVISPQPEIKVDLAIGFPYTVASDVRAHSIVIDEGTVASRTLALTAANVVSKTYAAGTRAEDERITGMTINYAFTEPLSEGKHTFKISAQSSGLIDNPGVGVLVASVEVLGGPVRLIGTPITYPSPFSIPRHRKVTIQYILSADANIDIFLISVAGQRIKRFSCDAGQEGGTAGVNKITWDGLTDQGFLAGNAIYVGTIVSRDDGRLLGRLKLTIVN